MSSKEFKRKIQEQFTVCEQQLIKAIEHTKKRIIESLDLFQKEKLNSINKSLLDLTSQIQNNNHEKNLEQHILLSINQMNEKFPEFQKILKAQIHIPLCEAIKKIDFDLPTTEILPTSFNLCHKKSLINSSTQISEKSAINCITSLPQSRIAVAVNTKIKVLEVNYEKIIASIVAHTEKITSLNYYNIKRLTNSQETIPIPQKAKSTNQKTNYKNSKHRNKLQKLNPLQDNNLSQLSQNTDESLNQIKKTTITNSLNNEQNFITQQVLISTSLDKRVQIINLEDFSLINTIKLNRQCHNTLQLSDREMLIQQVDGFSIFKDMKTKTGEFKFTQQIKKCAYSKKLNFIILHSKNKITIINKRTMRIMATYSAPEESLFMKVIQKQILIIHPNGIVVQNLLNGKMDKHKQLKFQSPICSLTDLNDKSHVAVISFKNEVSIIDYQNMKMLSTLNLGGKQGVRSITYMNDGQNFAINTVDNKIKLWTFSKN